jgi:hypothetical protein
MRKIIVTFAALLALAVPATAGAVGSPRWVTIPTCTATTSDLTCTGRAAGVQPQSIPEFGPVEAAIFGQVHWLCTDPLFDFIGTGTFGRASYFPRRWPSTTGRCSQFSSRLRLTASMGSMRSPVQVDTFSTRATRATTT